MGTNKDHDANAHMRTVPCHEHCDFSGEIKSDEDVWWCPKCACLFWEGIVK